MTRSRKKNPGGGCTGATSDKCGKVADHRRYRHYANNLTNEIDWDTINDHRHKENPYDWPKDGKIYWLGWLRDLKFMRK